MKKVEQNIFKVNRLVNVGTYLLHFWAYPGSKPAILFESWGGADACYWDTLAPAINRETGSPVITYDRSGYVESDLPDTPYNIRQEVAGLWAGLEQLGYAHSLIMLGHSWGGTLILVSSCDHPDSMCGMVFVDAMNVEFINAIGGSVKDVYQGLPLWTRVIQRTLIPITAAFCEELIWRGYIPTQMELRGYWFWPVVLLSSLSFAAIHGVFLPDKLLVTFLLGIVSTVFHLKERRLLPLMLTHWFVDLWVSGCLCLGRSVAF